MTSFKCVSDIHGRRSVNCAFTWCNRENPGKNWIAFVNAVSAIARFAFTFSWIFTNGKTVTKWLAFPTAAWSVGLAVRKAVGAGAEAEGIADGIGTGAGIVGVGEGGRGAEEKEEREGHWEAER
jgi:hypothetical protein